MDYLVVYIIGGILALGFISWLFERKRLRERAQAREAENAMIQEILDGFDVRAEREKIFKLLKENLPEGYRCGRRGCDGILLKRSAEFGGSYYVCSNCHNFRLTVTKRSFRND